MNDPVVIAGMARTPQGGLQGELSTVQAPALGAIAIKAALEKAKIGPADVDETIMGCVLPAGLGQAPARPGVNRGRHTGQYGLYDRKQDVRFGHEGGDAGV